MKARSRVAPGYYIFGGNLQMKEEKQICSCCKKEFHKEAMVEFEGQWLCGECLRRETVVCIRCGERMWFENNSGNDSTPFFKFLWRNRCCKNLIITITIRSCYLILFLFHCFHSRKNLFSYF